jgi:hypothetical protein
MKKVAFTIVLNGMPFIEKQFEIIPKVFDKWYIVEGVVKPTHDTGWCASVPKEYYSDNFTSIDGTSEFLDKIKSPKIEVIRKNDLWDGKKEMCNSFIDELENCILMEFDVDEIWNIDTLKDVLNYAEKEDYFHGMLFKCNYFVGPNLKIQNEDCYGNRFNEWSRLWKIKNKTNWISHEPPRLKGCTDFLTREFTKNKGWFFDHYAYVLEEQVKFKAKFYNYPNALEYWGRLQSNTKYPCYLRDFLPWVNDNAIVNKV